jgi:hypothetical protein
MEKRLRLIPYGGKALALVLTTACLLSVAWPSGALGRLPQIECENYSGSSGDPIDGERKYPIPKYGDYTFTIYSDLGGFGGAAQPPGGVTTQQKVRLPRPFILGIPGLTPVFYLYPSLGGFAGHFLGK